MPLSIKERMEFDTAAYGMSREALREVLTERLENHRSPEKLAVSMLSDVQEIIDRVEAADHAGTLSKERARKTINAVKFLLLEMAG